MIDSKDIGKWAIIPIARETMTMEIVCRQMEIRRNHYGDAHLVDPDNKEFSYWSHLARVYVPVAKGLKYKIYVYRNPPFTMDLPRGSMAARVKHIRSLFHPNCRIEVVKGSTRNNIRVRFISPRANLEAPGWELVALNIGDESGVVHTEKRRVRRAYKRTDKRASAPKRRN